MTGTCDEELHAKLLEEYRSRLDNLKAELLTDIPSKDDADNSQVDSFLAKSDLDDRLALFVVLHDATPKRLAQFAATSTSDEVSNQELVEQLFANVDLMKQMVLADGAKGGNYGDAMRIYNDIKRERNTEQCPATMEGFDLDDSKRQAPVLERLAIAISLEHAVKLRQDNPVAPSSPMDEFVDPVQRYLNYELAFLQGELDPNFCELSIWNLRMVVDGDEPDETAAWGRNMLRTFRPDHVLSNDLDWRYVSLVRSEVRYGSQHVKRDRKELQRYQNILMNGGVCGRRAFIGRFILRAFGIPTAGKPPTKRVIDAQLTGVFSLLSIKPARAKGMERSATGRRKGGSFAWDLHGAMAG